MPIGVITSGNAFPTTNEAQGDFGLDSGLNIMDRGVNSSGSYLPGYSYPYYLEQQYGINSYTLSFYPLSNGYYAYVSNTTPIGQLSFGVYNGNSNTLIPYTDTGYLPYTIGIFPSSSTNFSNAIFFDTGSNFNNLSTDVFQTEIPNFSQSSDENACANYGWPYGIVNGGFIISYSVQNIYGTSFTTEPPTSFCSTYTKYNLMEGSTVDAGFGVFAEDFGLPEMLRHTFTWVLAGKGSSNQGLVQYIGINP
ncbi:MAG: Retroviral aspartyl protease, partial [Hydrogenobaculum sp.]